MRGERKSKSGIRRGWLFALSSALLKLAALVFGLVAFYLVYVVIAGQLGTITPAGVKVLNTVSQALVISGTVTAVCLALLTLEEFTWMVGVGVAGIALMFGFPALVANYADPQSNEAARAVLYGGTLAGKAIIVVVGLRVIYEIYRQLAEGGERKRRKEVEEERARIREKPRKKVSESPFAPCWEMPFCHEAVRDLCPAYKARKTCWRFGRGCNCDPDLIETLIRSRVPTAVQGAGEREGAYIRSDLQADAVRSRSEKTIPCRQCPIYTDHQRRKYRVFSPLVILVTIVLFGVFFEPLKQVYSSITHAVASLASGMALGQETASIDWWKDYLDNSTLQTAFVIILGLFLLTWVIKATEWLILEKKCL